MLNNQQRVAVIANGGAFIFGTLLGWSAPTAGPIIGGSAYGFKVTSEEFAWIVGLMALGGVFSCVLSSVVRSKIGTRLSIALFGIPIVVGWAMITMATSSSQLMIGRFLTGVSGGCYTIVLPIYVGEISSDAARGSLLSIFQVALNFGVLFVFILGHITSVRVLNITCGLITVLYSLGFIFLPESPVLLVTMYRDRAAEYSYSKLNAKSSSAIAEIEKLRVQNERSKEERKSFADVFKTKPTKKAFMIMMFQFFFFQMCGINVVLFYSTSIFNQAGVDLDSGISSIIIATVQVIFSVLAFFAADRFGRKTLLILSNTFMFIGLLGIGNYFLIAGHLKWLPLSSLSIFIIAFSVGMGPVSFILLGELFSQEAKALVAPIGQTLNLFLTFVIGLLFPLFTAFFGMGLSFFLFSSFCFSALLFTIFVIPETKGKSRNEICILLENY